MTSPTSRLVGLLTLVTSVSLLGCERRAGITNPGLDDGGAAIDTISTVLIPMLDSLVARADDPDPIPTPAASLAPPVAPLVAVAPAALAAAATLAPSKNAVTVARSRCERAGCELVFTFSRPMVKRARLRRARPAPIVFDPPQKGSWSWRSPSELVFKPKAGQLHWGHEIDITLEKAVPLAGKKHALASPWSDSLRVPAYRVAGKWADWPVVVGEPRFVAILDRYNEEIGRGPLFFAFDQPVEPLEMAKHIRATANGRALKLAIWRPTSVARVWSESTVDTRPLLAVRVTNLPGEGDIVKLSYPKTLTGKKTDVVDSRNYATRRKFEVKNVDLVGAAASGRAPVRARWRVRLSGQVSTANAKRAITVTPTPQDLRVYSSGDSAIVRATLTPGRRYQVRVAAGLRDTLGNILKRSTRHAFVAQDLRPALAVPQNALVLESARARLPLRGTNIANVKMRAHHIGDVGAYIRQLAGSGGTCSVPEAARARTVAAKTARNRVVALDPGITLGRRGLACVELSAIGAGSEKVAEPLKASLLTQVTNMGITAKVHRGGIIAWVTRLSDAAPVAGAQVSLYGVDGSVVSKAKTGADGVARLDGKSTTSRATIARSFLVAETRADVALTELTSKRISQPWQFGLMGDVESSEPLTASVFTDRGVYRPKEKVRIKVIARQTGPDGALGIPTTKKVSVVVNDARGNAVMKKDLGLDEFGTTDATVELKENAAVGRYSVRVTAGDRVAVRTFSVEEYRVPTFEVAVKSDQSAWSLRESARVAIAADYLHGGKLAARRVAYTVKRVPAPLAPARFPGFSFGLQSAQLPESQVLAGEAKLDGQGSYSFDFKPSHPASAGPMRYVIDAHVTDVDRQAYNGQLARVVHPSDIYIGVRHPSRKVVNAGDAVEVPIIAIRPDGIAASGVLVVVTAEAIDYHTTARLSSTGVERRNRAVARAVTRCRVVSAEAAKSCTLKLPRAGYYRITASAVDRKKRKVASGFELTVGGDQNVAWPRFDHERIEILTDKPRYRAGDVAKLAIQSPFATARGILTIERGDVLEHRSFLIKNNTPILDIPITAAHAPNVYASVVLLRPRVHHRADATGFQTGAPAFRVGATKIAVEPEAARLGVTVGLGSKIAAPGGKLDITLDVRDAAGAPVSGQATVMVVDEAVLGLTRYKTPSPITELYRERALGVRTASSRLDLPHSRRARREPIFPGGDGGDWGDDGDEEGDAVGELGDLRNLFESTAYWNPRVAVKNGRASLTVDLPDNVTTFRVMAVVVDRGARAGADDAKVVVRKPVMVKPVLPRFAHPGDKIIVQARVFNGGTEPGDAVVSAHFVGMRRDNKKTPSQRVKPGRSATFSFPIEVVGREEAVIRFAAAIGTNKDAVEVRIPILDPGTRRKIIETRTISGTGAIGLKLPSVRVPGSSTLEILASATSLSELRGAVDYVMGYPNGCIEQTTSTAYPLIVLEDLLPDMGVTVDKAKLKEYATAGVKRLLSFQTTSGGLAYWPGSDKPHAFGTSFGLTALIEAKARGYEVPDKALAEMAAYLEKSLKSGEISKEMPHGAMADADTRALFVMTLGRLGRSRPADVALLWSKRDKLTAFGLSFLAVAVDEGHGERALLDPILDEIRKRAVENKDEAFFNGKRDRGWSMGSPLRTHAAALLAFSGTKRSSALSPKLLTGLIRRQRGGMWGNTQENVFGIMGVVKAIERRGGSDKAPKVKLSLDGKAIAASSLEKLSGKTLRYRDKLADGAAAKVSVVNAGGPPAIVTVRAEYDEPLTPATMKPVNKGFAVERRYETLAGRSLEGRAVPLGDVIAVRVRVTTTSSQNYVAVADRLPAGLEPLNTSLATTQKVAGRKPTAAEARGLGVLSYNETRDSRVAFYADALPAGTYEFTYLARATSAGTFRRPAAQADAMYEPEAVGTSSIDMIVVR